MGQRVNSLLADPEFAKEPIDIREEVLTNAKAQDDAEAQGPQKGLLEHAGGAAMDFVQGTNEGFYGSAPGGRQAYEAVAGQREPTSPFVRRVGQDVGAAAGFVLPVGAAARSAQAAVQAMELAGQTPGLAIAVIDRLGKSMLGMGAGGRQAQALVREARLAIQSGLGAAAAQEVFPDSKVAEIAGQLTATLGPEAALKTITWAARQVMGGPVLGAFTEEAAKSRVGKALLEAIPQGSTAEQGLERAVATQEATGLSAPVAHATGSPGVAAMERMAVAQHPDLAARMESRRLGTSEVVRERVAQTPGAGVPVSYAQGAVETALERQRGAAQQPVIEAGAALADANRRFAAAAQASEQRMSAAIAQAEAEAERLAAQLRPAEMADPRAMGQATRGVIEPAKAALKAERDALYAAVDPDNQGRLQIEPLRAAAAEAAADAKRQLIAVPTEVRRLLGELRRLGTNQADLEPGTAPFNVVRRWESALGDAIDNAQGSATPDARVIRVLARLKDQVGKTLDTIAQTAPEIGARLEAAKAKHAEYAQRFLDGVTSKVLARGDTAGGYKVAAEDVPGMFWRPASAKGTIQSISDYTAAAGTGPEALRTLRDAGLRSFFERTFRSGKMDVQQAGLWMEEHKGQLAELAKVGVDLRPELTRLRRQGATVEGLKTMADTARTRMSQGALPQAEGTLGVAAQHYDLAKAASERAIKDIDRSAAAAFVGADPDRAATTLLRGDAPAQRVRETMAAAAGDPAAQRGIRQAILNDGMNAARSPQAVATGNPIFDPVAFERWLTDNKAAVREAFGAQGTMYLMEQAAIARQVIGGPTSNVSTQTMQGAVTPEALYTFGQLFGRIYSTAKGFVGRGFLVAEGAARKVSSVLGGFSNEELKAVYEASLTDPKVAQTLRMLALPNAPAQVVTHRLRAHLANLGGRVTDRGEPLP